MKTGDYLEVRVPQHFTYTQVVAAAERVVDLESDPDGPLALIRANKTVVPNAPLQLSPASEDTLPWTIGNYLSTFTSFRKNHQSMKFGVAHLEEEGETHPGMQQCLMQYITHQLSLLFLVDSLQRGSSEIRDPTKTDDIEEPVHLLREKVEGW